MTIVTALLAALGVVSLALIVRWRQAAVRTRARGPAALERAAFPRPIHLAIGFVTNFFDTLGIGSFATTTTAYKLFALVPDERIPGTMIIGHSLPVVVQAFIYISVVEVNPTQLVALIAASIAGGWLGAGIVSKLPRRSIQLGMAVALLAAAFTMAMGMLGLLPSGGLALTLDPLKFTVALVVNFFLGAILTLGIGNYGPSLVLFSMLGMNVRAAFPIMMGSGAFVAAAAGVRFLDKDRYHGQAALGLTLGGIPGVLLAVWLFTWLPIDVVRWIVVGVVVYTAIMMIRSARLDTAMGAAPPAGAVVGSE